MITLVPTVHVEIRLKEKFPNKFMKNIQSLDCNLVV